MDRYELLEEVGSGGMAVVYRGRDTALDREVAVKLLHPHLAARPESRARFSREARAVARLAHPNIVEIYDFAGEHAIESYLVTEFVRGRTLRAFADDVGVGFPEIGALIARAIADALVHAHGAGVIHRDLKPENVLVVQTGRAAVKLVDFGIARILASDERMTMTGALVGSPNHMAPEIIEGREADARSDLFSLGTILYWLAVGEMPFAAPNPTATLRRVLEGDYRDPRDVSPLVSDALAAAIARTLRVDPEQRTASAAQLRDELDAILTEAGLGDPDEELAAFLAEPAQYRAAFPQRLAAALGAKGEEALRSGATARALKLFNHVLAVDPQNERVLGQLARLARRGQVRKAAGWAVVAAAVLAAAAGGWAAWARLAPFRESSTTQTATAIATSTPTATPTATGTPTATDAIPVRAEPSDREAVAESKHEPGTSPVPANPARASPAAATSMVAVLVRPYAQRALLDGVQVASGAQRVVFPLAHGQPHRIQIEHDCCVTFVRDFAADEVVPPQLELRVPLEPRPARLRVDAEPEARVLVDGRLVGTAGDSRRRPLAVPVPSGAATPYEGYAEIRVESPGQPPHVTQAKIRAGAELTVVAPSALLPAPEPEAAAAADDSEPGATASKEPAP